MGTYLFQDTDVNGCPMERCIRKECPKMPTLPENCLVFTAHNLTFDKCGCVRWDIGQCNDAGNFGMLHVACVHYNLFDNVAGTFNYSTMSTTVKYHSNGF